MKNKVTGYRLQVTKKQQSGQVIIILLLLTLVALSVGLAFTQRSITDLTTATQAEQASRSFSAAEAGLQKALTDSTPVEGLLVPLNNNSSALVDSSAFLPYPNSHMAIEYPKIGRETTAQFWLVDPAQPPPPVNYYDKSRIALYYGNSGTTDAPAVEVKIIYLYNGVFSTYTKYYDSVASRASSSGFSPTLGCNSVVMGNGTLGTNRKFFCREEIGPILTKSGGVCISPACILVMARIRLLYINENHSLALEPMDGANFPPQVQIYNALGTSGQSQKQLQAFRVRDVVLPWFDFALFSINEIRK